MSLSICNKWTGLNDGEKIHVCFQILLLWFGLQIKYSSVKLQHHISKCQMKDGKERNYFSLRTTFWKCHLPTLKCVWKVHHKNWTFQWQNVYKNVIHWIVASNALALSRIVTHCYATSFLRRVILYETTCSTALGTKNETKPIADP